MTRSHRTKDTDTRPLPHPMDSYEISIDGRIWSRITGKWLAPYVSRIGYKSIKLPYGEGRRSCSVHRLVALAWVANPSNLPEVNHIDGDKLNNHASNLEWCSRSYNLKHAVGLGLMTNNGPISKLSDNDVRDIRVSDETNGVLATRYKVSRPYIVAIRKGRMPKKLKRKEAA